MSIYKGSTLIANSNETSLITTKGDLIVGNDSGKASRLGIGSNGQVLKVQNGTAQWDNVTLPTKISDLTDDTSTNPIDKADTLTGLTATVSELNYTDGVTSNIQTQLDSKQNTLTAGTNISISGTTISATDTTYTAGNGITISGQTISADTTVLQTINNKVTSISSSSTDTQYPSAKCVYDIVGNIEATLNAIRGV